MKRKTLKTSRFTDKIIWSKSISQYLCTSSEITIWTNYQEMKFSFDLSINFLCSWWMKRETLMIKKRKLYYKKSAKMIMIWIFLISIFFHLYSGLIWHWNFVLSKDFWIELISSDSMKILCRGSDLCQKLLSNITIIVFSCFFQVKHDRGCHTSMKHYESIEPLMA